MQSKYLSTSALLFSKTLNITSTEISYQFLAPKVPFLRRNKVTNSSTSTDPFSAAAKPLVLDNLFKHVWFAITFARVVRLPLGIMTRMRKWMANFPCECDVKSKNLAVSYQVQGLSVQLQNGRLEVLKLLALFLLKTETSDAKNSWEFFVDAIFGLVKIGFEKSRGTNRK